jgi:hypothetical protein
MGVSVAATILNIATIDTSPPPIDAKPPPIDTDLNFLCPKVLTLPNFGCIS